MSQLIEKSEIPLHDKLEFIKYMMMFPAITLMVIVRRKVGYRLLKSSWLVIMAVLLSAFDGLYGNLSGISTKQPLGFLMTIYIYSMLGAGFFQQWMRWRAITQGKRWHTYSSGVSYLECLPLPQFFHNHRRIYRIGDPAMVFFIGLFVSGVCHPLGWWLMFASIGLYIYETTVYERALEADLDTLDLLIAAEVRNETVAHFQSENAQEKLFRLDDTAGIATGLSPDLQKVIEMRKIKLNAEKEL